jgi:uncharacterized damage-inducible protein DinB
MKHLRMLCLLAALSVAAAIVSQGQGAAPAAKPATPAPQAQASPQPAPTISSVVDREISTIEKQVVDLAEAMPADKFDFTPTNLNLKDSRDPVRSFAFQVKHIATANYAFWSPLTGDPMPASIKGPNGPEELKSKAEIIKFLKDSYALGHKAAATLTAENVVEQVPFRQNKAPRLYLATFAVAHGFDHYGQLAIYLRLSGITPPGSRAQ